MCVTATIFNNANHVINVYGDDIEVDYRGYEVHTRDSLSNVDVCLSLAYLSLICYSHDKNNVWLVAQA